MKPLASETELGYRERIQKEGVPIEEHESYLRWVRFYLDFCHKYGHPARDELSLGTFLEKLTSKGQGTTALRQAHTAVRLLLRRRTPRNVSKAVLEDGLVPSDREPISEGTSWEAPFKALEGAIRMRNYSSKTFAAYRMWVQKLQSFTRSKAPGQRGCEDVKAFLSELAVRHRVAASTQNQAFNALLFFFRHVLGKDFGRLDGLVRAKRRPYVPVVLSHAEVDALILELRPPYRLVVQLLYGCGLRLGECLELRVHCFNLEVKLLTIHDGKGQKDRSVPLPGSILADIHRQLDLVRETLTIGPCIGIHRNVSASSAGKETSSGTNTKKVWECCLDRPFRAMVLSF